MSNQNSLRQKTFGECSKITQDVNESQLDCHAKWKYRKSTPYVTEHVHHHSGPRHDRQRMGTLHTSADPRRLLVSVHPLSYSTGLLYGGKYFNTACIEPDSQKRKHKCLHDDSRCGQSVCFVSTDQDKRFTDRQGSWLHPSGETGHIVSPTFAGVVGVVSIDKNALWRRQFDGFFCSVRALVTAMALQAPGSLVVSSHRILKLRGIGLLHHSDPWVPLKCRMLKDKVVALKTCSFIGVIITITFSYSLEDSMQRTMKDAES